MRWLGRWLVAVGCAPLVACGAGGDARPATATVPAATTTTFDVAHLAAQPDAASADFAAVVRELYAVRDEAYHRSDPGVLRLVYHEQCPCLGEEVPTLEQRAAAGLVEVGNEPQIVRVTVLEVVSPNAVFVEVVHRASAGELLLDGRAVNTIAGWRQRLRRLALVRNGRWQIVELADCSLVRKGPRCVES